MTTLSRRLAQYSPALMLLISTDMIPSLITRSAYDDKIRRMTVKSTASRTTTPSVLHPRRQSERQLGPNSAQRLTGTPEFLDRVVAVVKPRNPLG